MYCLNDQEVDFILKDIIARELLRKISNTIYSIIFA